MSLEFEYLHRKSRCEMLIAGDDISNDVTTLGTCFSMFVYIRAHFRFTLIGGNLTVQSTGTRRGNGGGIQIPETQLQALPPFSAPPPEHPRHLARKLPQPELLDYSQPCFLSSNWFFECEHPFIDKPFIDKPMIIVTNTRLLRLGSKL